MGGASGQWEKPPEKVEPHPDIKHTEEVVGASNGEALKEKFSGGQSACRKLRQERGAKAGIPGQEET